MKIHGKDIQAILYSCTINGCNKGFNYSVQMQSHIRECHTTELNQLKEEMQKKGLMYCRKALFRFAKMFKQKVALPKELKREPLIDKRLIKERFEKEYNTPMRIIKRSQEKLTIAETLKTMRKIAQKPISILFTP